MGKDLSIILLQVDLLTANCLVSISDTLSIVFGLAATLLGAGAIWATRLRNGPTTRGL